MHIDSLTLTALIVFVIMLAVFVRFCRVKVCGNINAYRQDKQDSTQEGDGS
jgi:hypothetical protein